MTEFVSIFFPTTIIARLIQITTILDAMNSGKLDEIILCMIFLSENTFYQGYVLFGDINM